LPRALSTNQQEQIARFKSARMTSSEVRRRCVALMTASLDEHLTCVQTVAAWSRVGRRLSRPRHSAHDPLWQILASSRPQMLGRWQGDNGDLKRSISNRQLKSPQYQTLAVRSLTGTASASDKVGLCSQIKPTKRFYSRPLNPIAKVNPTRPAPLQRQKHLFRRSPMSFS